MSGRGRRGGPSSFLGGGRCHSIVWTTGFPRKLCISSEKLACLPGLFLLSSSQQLWERVNAVAGKQGDRSGN